MTSAKTVMVADDNEHIRVLLKELLESAGYRVILAHDGLEGMDKLEKESIDLLLVDIRLPYISGIGLVKIAGKSKPGLPIVCMNSHGSGPESIIEEECGAVVISKPFKAQELLKLVRDMLK
jgi:DNA-binding NtrC family response regulator